MNPTLSAYISPQTPTDVQEYAGRLGRESMQMVGNPGQQGQPMGPGLVGQPMAGGMPGVLAAPPMNPQAMMAQGAMPAGAAQQGVPVPGQNVGDLSMQIAMQLMNMDPQQALLLISQIPDPQAQQMMLQITAMLNPAFAAMVQGGMGPEVGPVQQPGQAAMAGMMPPAESPLAGLTPDQLLAAGGGVNPIG